MVIYISLPASVKLLNEFSWKEATLNTGIWECGME
jgi:hypothetical protein